MNHGKRSIFLIATAALLLGRHVPASASWDSWDPEFASMIEDTCLDCHDDLEQKGNFRLDNLAPMSTDPCYGEDLAARLRPGI